MTALLSSTGTVLASYYYDAFGNIVEQDGNFGNPYRYSGYMYDEESRLYNLNARFYDAKIARFMQEDTYLGNGADPLSLNLYAYCRNNPIKYWDPTGHYLSDADKANLTPTQQAAIEKLTDDWNAAKAAGNADAMKKANDDANAIRAGAGYSGGTDGKTITPTSPGTGVKVTDVAPDAKWHDDRTITYTNSSGQEVTLTDKKDFYCYDGKAYFFNDVRTILEAAGAGVKYNDKEGTITVTPSPARPPTSNELVNSILYANKPLVSGQDFYIGWDGKAHFVDSSFGPVKVTPKPGGPHESLKNKSTDPAADGEFFWPTTSTKITDDHGTYRSPTRTHDGIDIAGPMGNPVYSAIDGTVTTIRWQGDDNEEFYIDKDGNKVERKTNNGTPYQGTGAGYYIGITSSDGKTETWYMHLKADSAMVSVGDTVVAGQQIAVLGNTGNGVEHLHFRVHIDDEEVDPGKLDYSNR